MIQELRHSARLLLQSRALTAVAILSLALGIGANSAMFSLVDAVLLKPLPYAEPDRLVALHEHPPGEPNMLENVSLANYADWKTSARSFVSMAAYVDSYAGSYNVTGAGEAERVRAPSTSAGFFATLGVAPLLGRELREGEAHRVVLLSHGFWMRKFGGDPYVIGSEIALTGEPYTVIGVLPPGFRFGRDVDLWRQIDLEIFWRDFSRDPRRAVEARANRGWYVFARLRRGSTLDQAQAEMSTVAARLALDYPRENGGRGARVIPLHEDVSGSAAPPLAVLYAAVCLVLLIACANVAGLLLARLAARQREIGVRMALGASRRRLARQLLTESLVLAAPAAAMGLLIAVWLVDAIVGIAPADLPRLDEVTVSGGIVVFTTVLSVSCAVLFGLAPMLQAWRLDPSTSLAEGRSIAPASRRARVVLLVGQMALSLVLMTGAGLLMRSYQRLGGVHQGFSPEDVATIELAPQGAYYFDEWDRVVAFYERTLSEAAAVPGVQSVAVSSLAPLEEGQFDERVASVDAPDNEVRAEYRFVSPTYFSTLRISPIRGREFSASDRRHATPVVILGESTATRLFGDDDPIGKELVLRARKRAEVVGVVPDTHLLALASAPPLQLYVPFPQADIVYWTGLDVLIKSAGPVGSVVPLVRERLRTVDAAIPPSNARTMDTVVRAALAPARMWATMLAAFAGLAVLLACVGLYGLMATVVVQRARELAIRLALGASSRGLAALVLRDTVRVIAGGLAIGTVVSLASSRFLQSLLFEISPTDWRTFAGVTVALTAVALAASLGPVRRAMRVDPATALRVE